MRQHTAIELFAELLVPSLSGSENGVARIIRDKLRSIGYTCETDPAGNVMIRLPGRDPEASLFVFAAHMAIRHGMR